LYWTVAGLFLILPALAFWALRRIWTYAGVWREDPVHAEGLADRGQIRRAAGSRALLARAAALRPAVEKPGPADVGLRLGRSRGVDCWASVEDSILLLGPPRSGKGRSVVIPTILDAPGAVLTTSTRPDNLAVTFSARARRGRVVVFDPQGLAHAPGFFPTLRWSPIRGCERPQVAMARAETLVADASRSGVENASFWRTQAVSAVRCLLHAAALAERNPADLYRWSHAAPAAKEAIAILAQHRSAACGWDRALDAIVGADERMRDSTWAMVANTFSPLADPAVLEAVSPGVSDQFDPARFLTSDGTLYLLGTASGVSATANLVAALAEDVIEVARQLAAASAGGRLDPPLAVVLDEAANYPLPSLPALMSEGGGSGITTMAVLQSLSQARDRWGREAAGSIWDAAIVKVILGGSANADDLGDLSRLIGDRPVKEHSETTSGWGAARSVSTTVRYRPILEPADIRRIRVGFGLLLLRSAPPIMMTLSPWMARKDANRLTQERLRFEQAVRTAKEAIPMRNGQYA
jgi:type IV secretory pathway TraG/TraD family ATPase VirD4